MRVYLEVGQKKVFAAAVDWPGWARSGKTEEEALEALVDYGWRYRASLGRAVAELEPPTNTEQLDLVARLKGGSGTDFGVPSEVAEFDRATVDDTE